MIASFLFCHEIMKHHDEKLNVFGMISKLVGNMIDHTTTIGGYDQRNWQAKLYRDLVDFGCVTSITNVFTYV